MKLLFSLLLVSACASAAPKPKSFSELKKLAGCVPQHISHWIQEKDVAKEVTVSLGEWTLLRTDVADSDGRLTLKRSNKVICDFAISLVPDIYLASKNQVLVTWAYSGSASWYTFYDVSPEGKCKVLGVTKDDKETKEMKAILSGDALCNTK